MTESIQGLSVVEREADAPAGYEFTGAVRRAKKGEFFLSPRYARAHKGPSAGVRRILRPSPEFVNVTTLRRIWVTLPGDNAGHQLTEAEAAQLIRELEEALS